MSDTVGRFGERLRKARAEAGKSQTDVAKALEVSQPTVSQWESGEIYPTPANLLRLANLFGLDAGELLELMVAEVPAA